VVGKGRALVVERSAPRDRGAVGNDRASIALVQRPAPAGDALSHSYPEWDAVLSRRLDQPAAPLEHPIAVR
jgi:hypothetical protein